MILSELVFLKKVEVCLSDEIFSEYIDVLRREKFYRILGFKVRAEMVLERIREISVFYQVNDSVKILKDASDNKFLELALASNANFLTTGNTKDFILNEYKNTKILTPREYWDVYAPK